MLFQESSHNPSSPSPQTTASPPSPTHEFSFTVSLRPHPPPPLTSPQDPNSNTYNNNNDNNNHKTNTLLPPPSLTAIDLSPADDIFLHGHLLPLHHLPLSPRSSTNSIDNFTLPIKDLLYDPIINHIGNTSFHCHHQTTFSDFHDADRVSTCNQNRPKSKPFSLFKWKKRSDDERERDEADHQNINRERNSNNNRKKLKLDLGQLIKRYMKMVRPMLSFPKSKRGSNITAFNGHQSYSFSGNSLSRKPPEQRGQLSAPASMKTSPTNSGILYASGTVSPAKSTTSESTMEELHAAIQAAIAHCKNSIAMEDKL